MRTAIDMQGHMYEVRNRSLKCLMCGTRLIQLYCRIRKGNNYIFTSLHAQGPGKTHATHIFYCDHCESIYRNGVKIDL